MAESQKTKWRISASDVQRIGEAAPGTVQSDKDGFYFLATEKEAEEIRMRVKNYGAQFVLGKAPSQQELATLEGRLGFSMAPRWSYALIGLGLTTLMAGELVLPLISTGIAASDKPYRYGDLLGLQLLATAVLLPLGTFVGWTTGYLAELAARRQ